MLKFMTAQMNLDNYVEKGFYLHDKIHSDQKQIKCALNSMVLQGEEKVPHEPIVQSLAQEDTLETQAQEAPEAKDSKSSTSSSSEDEDDNDVASASSSSS